MQGYDRYAYVNNDPVRYTDPTGHRACGEDETVNCNGQLNHPSIITTGCGNLGQTRCNGNPPFYGNGLIGPPVMPSIGAPNNQGIQGKDLQHISYFVKYGKSVIEIIIWVGDHGQPLYKQVKGLGTFGPVAEGTAGGLIQIAQDIDNPNLSPMQRALRPLAIAIEDGVTEVFSEPWAVAGAEFGADLGVSAGAMVGSVPGTAVGGLAGGIIGYEAGSLGVTSFFDNVVWDPFNTWIGLFP